MIVILQAEKQKEKSILNPKENDREENRRQKNIPLSAKSFFKVIYFISSIYYFVLCKKFFGKRKFDDLQKIESIILRFSDDFPIFYVFMLFLYRFSFLSKRFLSRFKRFLKAWKIQVWWLCKKEIVSLSDKKLMP